MAENFDTKDPEVEKEIETSEDEKDLKEAVEEQLKKDEAELLEEVSEEEEEEEESEEESEEDQKKKKKDKKDEMIEDLQDRVKRQMAEFENFRKRSEKEKSHMFDTGQKNVIEKILPIIDNFERGLSEAKEGDPFADGMSMIYKQLLTSFEQLGVTEIEAVGQQFDPELHNAVMHVEDENYGENEVVEVMQKGYKLHDEVIRHSMVKVAN